MFVVCTESEENGGGIKIWAVKSKCFRSMRKSEKPHEITIHFDGTIPEQWKCSCAAGNLLCQHVVGTLHQLISYQQLNLRTVPLMESKTSLPQTWHIPSRKKGIEPQPILQSVVQKPKREPNKSTKKTVTDGVRSTLYNAVAAPLSTIQLNNMLLPAMRASSINPQVTQLWHFEQQPQTVNTTFGLVPKGSLLSYQLNPRNLSTSDNNTIVVPSPPLPQIQFPELHQRYNIALNLKEQNVYDSLTVTTKQAVEIERITRAQSESKTWFDVRKKSNHFINIQANLQPKSRHEAIGFQHY